MSGKEINRLLRIISLSSVGNKMTVVEFTKLIKKLEDKGCK